MFFFSHLSNIALFPFAPSFFLMFCGCRLKFSRTCGFLYIVSLIFVCIVCDILCFFFFLLLLLLFFVTLAAVWRLTLTFTKGHFFSFLNHPCAFFFCCCCCYACLFQFLKLYWPRYSVLLSMSACLLFFFRSFRPQAEVKEKCRGIQAEAKKKKKNTAKKKKIFF